MKLLPQKLMVLKVSRMVNANVFWSMYSLNFTLRMTKFKVLVLRFPYFTNNYNIY
jgi:hypothetical protein